MKRILIPCDFSESSETALSYALDLANSLSCDLLLAHINQYPIMTPEVGLSAYTYQDATKDSLDALDKLRQRIKNEHQFNGRIETYSDMGEISNEVLKLSREKSADLIVMGINSHGNNLVKNLIGSSAVSVAKKSEIPVLVIPPGNQFRKPKTIVYACEYEEQVTIEPGYLKVKEFASSFGAELLVLHVVLDKKAHNIPAHEHYIQHGSHDNAKTFVVHEKKASSAILHFIKDHSVDLVAIEPKKHSFIYNVFHKGITDEIVFHSPVPVLTVHE